MAEPLTLVLRCPDSPGIMAAVTGFVSAAGATILESSHYLDRTQQRLSRRVAFAATGAPLDLETVRARFQPIAQTHAMNYQIFDGGRVGTILMVSRFGHCLFDLVHHWQAGLLRIRIDAVVSNHETHRSFVEWAGLPFHYGSVRAMWQEPHCGDSERA